MEDDEEKEKVTWPNMKLLNFTLYKNLMAAWRYIKKDNIQAKEKKYGNYKALFHLVS